MRGDYECQAFDVEVRVYHHLGHHKRIAQFEETTEGLILERGECLRRRLQLIDTASIPISTKLQWAQDAAEGLAYLHSRHIVHADVGCHNMILDNTDHVKLIDFAGSRINGEEALVCYEWCSFRPGKEIDESTDIFAFGSMLFEVETGKVPFHELEQTMEMGRLVTTVEGLLSEGNFPSVKNLTLGSIISGCWNDRYKSMKEVYDDLTTYVSR
jgi:serine/threonine protein kinase